MTETATVTVDCHAYPWHVVDPLYPECGPENLTRMAEQYGVLVRFLPDHPWSDWAWWYSIEGPRDSVARLLTDEGYCEPTVAAEIVR